MTIHPADYKILVVDDDLDSASLLQQHLRACGYRVNAVKTAAMVLKKVLQESPSLIVMDLMSPSRAGLRICRELTTNAATQHVPIIMVTSESDETDKIVALELGVDDYVLKPFNLHELSLRIERSLARAAYNREPMPSHHS